MVALLPVARPVTDDKGILGGELVGHHAIRSGRPRPRPAEKPATHGDEDEVFEALGPGVASHDPECRCGILLLEVRPDDEGEAFAHEAASLLRR